MKHVIPTLAIALIVVLLGGSGPVWARDKLDRHTAQSGRDGAETYHKVGRGQAHADHRQQQRYTRSDGHDGQGHKQKKQRRAHKKKHNHNSHAHAKRRHDRRHDRHVDRHDRRRNGFFFTQDRRHNGVVVRNDRRFDAGGHNDWYDRARAARLYNERHGNSSWDQPWIVYRRY